MVLALTREDFLAAAEAARGMPLQRLYEEAGIGPGPSRRRLTLEGVELPLRLFVALAARRRLGAAADLTALTQAQALAAAAAAGVRLADAHESERPIRTG